MKIYALKINGETEWLAANTIIEALQMYVSITGIELMEFNNDDDIKEVSKEKWPELKVQLRDDEIYLEEIFTEVMSRIKRPDIISIPYYDCALQ